MHPSFYLDRVNKEYRCESDMPLCVFNKRAKPHLPTVALNCLLSTKNALTLVEPALYGTFIKYCLS